MDFLPDLRRIGDQARSQRHFSAATKGSEPSLARWVDAGHQRSELAPAIEAVPDTGDGVGMDGTPDGFSFRFASNRGASSVAATHQRRN
jgi:hypothetical protein